MSSAPAVRTRFAHLLIVDDNSMGLQARKTVLEELGYSVSAVATPHEALERLSQSRFDLVITDYRLPDMSGKELISSIRERHGPLPVVLLTGFADALGLDEKNTGADAVVQKSAYEVGHLVRTVRSLLKRKKPPSSVLPTPPRRRRETG